MSIHFNKSELTTLLAFVNPYLTSKSRALCIAIQTGHLKLFASENIQGGSVLVSMKGIGQQTALKIKAAFSLSLVMNTTSESVVINSPADVAALVHAEMSLLEKEHLRVILLDRRNRVISIEEVYVGSVSSAQVRLGEVFHPAIRRNASSIILIHNHPTGDCSPSPDDIAVTREAVKVGKILDIDLLDHLIIGKTWKSLKESGLGFS